MPLCPPTQAAMAVSESGQEVSHFFGRASIEVWHPSNGSGGARCPLPAGIHAVAPDYIRNSRTWSTPFPHSSTDYSLTSRSSSIFLHCRRRIFTTTTGKMAHEQSYIMIKPDGVQRNLVGEVIKR